MMRLHKYFFLVFLLMVLSSCETTPPEEDHEAEPDDNLFTLEITIKNSDGKAVSAGSLHIFEPGEKQKNTPLQSVQADENGLASTTLEKGLPYTLQITAAWKTPLYLFITSHSEDTLRAVVQPESVGLPDELSPKIFGSFNNFDLFRAQEMEPISSSEFQAKIPVQADTLDYMIEPNPGFLNIHGTDGQLRFSLIKSSNTQGIETRIITSDSIKTITFNAEKFRAEASDHVISFDDDAPSGIAGPAKIYAEMMRSARQIQHHSARDEPLPDTFFDEYKNRTDLIVENYPVTATEQAAALALANFSSYTNPDEEWIDAIMGDIASNSDLWLMHYPVLSEMFLHSTREEAVSQHVWNVYRQHQHKNVRGEALYNLLKFHYERGEDEEWYQAHYDLVREYSDHIRINHSYKNEFAPKAVVHRGEYFPDLTFTSAIDDRELSPISKQTELTVVFVFDLMSHTDIQKFNSLSDLQDQFGKDKLKILPVVLTENPDEVQRFKSHSSYEGVFAMEKLSSPVIQVLGITESPHAILLDAEKRMLRDFDSAHNMDQIVDFIEKHLSGLP